MSDIGKRFSPQFPQNVSPGDVFLRQLGHDGRLIVVTEGEVLGMGRTMVEGLEGVEIAVHSLK